MNIAGKIRVLIVILAICFLGTAISIREIISPANVLLLESAKLESHLHEKEKIVQNFLRNKNYNSVKIKALKNDYEQASIFLKNFDQVYNIHLLVYKNQTLDFWSSYLSANINIAALPEGASFARLENGWYELVTHRFENYSMVFLIKIKNAYSYQNQYLINDISTDLLKKNNLDIADFADHNVANIKTFDNKYLFSVKLKNTEGNNLYTQLSLWSCLLGVLCVCLLINSISKYLLFKGHTWSSILIISISFLAIRISDLQYGWLDKQYRGAFFDPKIYGQSFYLPSLGDFLINILLLSWFLIFVFKHRKKFLIPSFLVKKQFYGIIYLFIILLSLVYIGYQMDEVFFGLIENSTINLRVANIMSMDLLSLTCIFILCLSWLCLYLFISIVFEWLKQFQLSFRLCIIIYMIGFSCFILYYIFFQDFTIFFIIYAIIIALRGYAILLNQGQLRLGTFVVLLFCFALNSSIKYDRYNRIKERSNRIFLAQRLEKKDQNALIAIPALEKEIKRDDVITTFFNNDNINKNSALQNYILKKYLSGYLAKYEFNLYEFDSLSELNAGQQIILEKYRSLVKNGAVKLPESNYFYEVNGTFGHQIFFGLIPVSKKRNQGKISLLLLEFKSKPFGDAGQLPDLLVEGKTRVDEEFKDYSIGFFVKGNLINQIGKFAYQLRDTSLNHLKTNKEIILNDGNGFGHIVYKSSDDNVIVITHKLSTFMEDLATLSFYFLVFTVFSILLFFIAAIFNLIDNYRFNWITFNRSLVLNANRVLYKTRIQVSMVIAVVFTLLIIGWITYYYVSKEYREQQNLDMTNKISATVSNFEKQFINTNSSLTTQQSLVDFNYFSETNGVDLNFYNDKGDIKLSTLPKLYQKGIVLPKMDALSFITMDHLNRSLYINLHEQIGDYTFATAYAPVRNSLNATIGYLGIPFFNNESSYREKINLFINTLINVYALVFVAIGFLAVAIANQITAPLTMIQERMRDTQIGQANKPINWRRQDEIGALIKEYNAMIAALEHSARKLALSERENAWREMAKQVAHEIKNPLTPLKLGIQLLERAWKAQDPNFSQKFEKFSSSFIEQIDSLSKIATEFSDFAKMPQAQLQIVEMVGIISQAVAVYQNMEYVKIIFNSDLEKALIFGDKDQLLRVFNNLLKNAIEARKNYIDMLIQIHLTQKDNLLKVTVSDNGIGIPLNAQQQIFTPNFTTKSSGTGLGLAFVKQAIEICGGNIQFSTHLNEGTKFTIEIPLYRNEETESLS